MQVYAEMLAEIGIKIPHETVNQDLNVREQCCGTVEGDDHEGHFSCSRCGHVVNSYMYVGPRLYAYDPNGRRNNHGYNLQRRRFYKIQTHFRTHLKQYVNSGPIRRQPMNERVDLAKLGREIDSGGRDAYHQVRAWLKKEKLPHLYRDTWSILYAIGGYRPVVTCEQMKQVVKHFDQIQHYFVYVWSERKRHNMPSVSMLLELLLQHVGHSPYYIFPYLKSTELRQRVLDFFYEYLAYIDATRSAEAASLQMRGAVPVLQSGRGSLL